MAPKAINIRRDYVDDHYRYKMEPLQTKIEGKGNGIKTILVNLNSVATSLERDPEIIQKYFGFEIGAQTTADKKNERWIINGAHEAAKLQDLLDGFIQKFILCRECKNPETVFELDSKDKKTLKLACKACPYTLPVLPGHKLYAFVVKRLQEKQKKEDMEAKAERRLARKAKQNGTATEADDADAGADDADDNDEDGKEDSTGSPNQEDEDEDPELAKLRAEVARVEVAAPEASDVWATDTTKEGVEARAAQIAGVSGFDKLGFWISEQNEALGDPLKVDAQSILDKIEELGIEGEFKTVQVLAQTLFDENIVTQIPKRVDLLQKVVHDDDDLEMAIIVGTERLFGGIRKVNKEFCKLSGKVLQLYYLHEVVSEEVIWQWAKEGPNDNSKTSRQFHDGAKKFLELLKEAESEGSDDDDDDSE
ncbi:hypothetical protein NLU13_6940 [Sarocladium strictum]|uniref:W2 domain-containing protein n=1 Tax=Sarocladium strictum TaxID=5046 RepID=A0AA39GEB5_SARSR|nr:hypothetical protein NLU13_6940 [Sarocladium strictum]